MPVACLPVACLVVMTGWLQVDTSALTGEPFPRKVPADPPDDDQDDDQHQHQHQHLQGSSSNGGLERQAGGAAGGSGSSSSRTREEAVDWGSHPRALLSGCAVKQGEAYCRVARTGLHTEIGQAARLMQQAGTGRKSVLEQKILWLAKAIIVATLAVVIAIVVVQASKQAREGGRERGAT